jgi:serine/threonine protein kinase
MKSCLARPARFSQDGLRSRFHRREGRGWWHDVVYKAQDRELGGKSPQASSTTLASGRTSSSVSAVVKVTATSIIRTCAGLRYGSDQGHPFISSWVVRARRCDLLARRKLDEDRCSRSPKVAPPLQATHGESAHRDIKPGNVMTTTGECVSPDFSVAGGSGTRAADIYPVPVTPRYTAPSRKLQTEGGPRGPLSLGLVLQEY